MLHALLGLSGATPVLVAVVGIGAHVCYRLLLADFPFFDFASFPFIGSLGRDLYTVIMRDEVSEGQNMTKIKKHMHTYM